MNKIFKIVFNAARGKMMIVNEATSSVQTGKKAAVTVAVVGALMSGAAVAADLTFTSDAEVGANLSNITEKDNVTVKYTDANPSSNVYYKAALKSGYDLAVNNLYVDSNVKAIFIHNKGQHLNIDAAGDVEIKGVRNAIHIVDDNGVGDKSVTINALGDVKIGCTSGPALFNNGSGSIVITAGEDFVIDAANGISNNAHGKTIEVSAKNIHIETAGSWSIATNGGMTGATVNLIAEEDVLVKNEKTGTSQYVIQSFNAGDVNIEAKTGKTVVEGNIKTMGAGTVDAVFNTADSHFTGLVIAEGEEGGTSLEMNNGAAWNVTGDSTVKNFGGEGGVVNIPNGVAVTAVNTTGSSTINLATDGETAGSFAATNAKDSKIAVNLTGVTADDIKADKAAELIGNVQATDATVTGHVEEGMYNGAMTVGSDGGVTTATNSVMSNTLDLASAAPLAMNRLLMNDVRKRMGDLRAAEGTHGVWARYDGGKLSGANGLENDFTTVQVGIDTVPVADAPRFGVAFAYTKSDADMKRGGAEMDAFSLAFYGTKFYDNGMFVDVIGRMATADTDVTVEGQKGTMDNVALSLSGELGWRFDVTDKFYFEPQAELTYTYVNADSLTLSDNSSYEFDSVDSLMGRVGFAAGFKCPNNFGDVYVRASAVHEFLGDAAVTGGNGTIHEVDGEDTWVEYGIGANFNINKNTYVYADIERTEGAKLEEDWRANVGVRFAF